MHTMHPMATVLALLVLVASSGLLLAIVGELLDELAEARENERDDEALALVARLQEVTR